MATYQAGEFVVHKTLREWGRGKVLEYRGEDKYDVFFERVGKKRMPGDFLRPAPDLPAQKTSAPLAAASKDKDYSKFQGEDKLIHEFLDLFPGGFQDPEYMQAERAYKLEAVEFLRQSMSRDILQGMLERQEHEAICKLALRVINKTNLVFPQERMAFSDGFKHADAETLQSLAQAFVFHLHGEAEVQARFNTFVTALEDIQAAKWTTSTYFLFLQAPESWPFLKPTAAKVAAEAFGWPFKYTTAVQWATYSQYKDFLNHVRERVEGKGLLKPMDMIDIQSFLYCADPASYSAADRKQIKDKRAIRLAREAATKA